MFHENSDKNKFGYYSVGEFKTYSKFEAILLAQNSAKPVIWHFNDLVFSSYDWTKEPAESITDIYARRARQIREKYDYLVLMYSGGADSTNVLRTFIDNGILIDEICSVHEYEGIKDRHGYHTGEILNSAIPLVKDLIPNGSKTRYRLVDSSQHQYDALTSLSVDQRDESYYEYNIANNLANLKRLRVREYIEDYKKIIDSGKRLCLVWGEAKPQTRWSAKQQCHEFVFEEQSYDMIGNVTYQRENHPGYHDEMFYHSADCPELIAKQAHLCLWHLKNPGLNPGYLTEKNSVPATIRSQFGDFNILNPDISQVETFYNGKIWTLTKSALHSIIYPGQGKIIYDQGKNANRLYHPRDEWLRKAAIDDSTKWYQGFLRVMENISEEWKIQPQGKIKYSIRKMTNQYPLENNSGI